ncbi:acetyltransferase [Thalassoglobus neptunius]|uniref:Acetyltransferase n=1 Tax=Thalassoglobus neptunius TaxID=1938619 RepID=A0A5C5VS87_9PLAN|nr:N-acetyltransferase [Thalassoglobus neptunius]TWT40621.1 acetyltransferase [Thalassoglobus neptunius]
MKIRSQQPNDENAIAKLFHKVFSDSEGEQEGKLIGQLATEMIATTEAQDLYGFVAIEEVQIVGAIFFSRLTFETENNVFILSPVAVDTEHQSQGIGQSLIRHGLAELKNQGVRFAITYGDPAFYSKVGFHSIATTELAPPYSLSQPEGWLGQSLTDDPIGMIPGHSVCVKALDNPVYW